MVEPPELTSAATRRRDFAADLLQVQPCVINYSIVDCNSRRAAMLPYVVAVSVVWIVLFLARKLLGIPFGPG
jgi:hypothetical protein